jgi:hypothetical protein
MRKILCSLLLVGGLLLCITSCSSEYKLDDQLISKYYKLLCIKDAGVQTFSVYTASKESQEDSIIVVKGGSHITESANAKIKSLSIAEMQEDFSEESDGYTVMPSDFYSFVNSSDVAISGEDRIYKLKIKFDAAKIRAAVKANPNLKLALPLQLYSETDTINTNYDKMLIKINPITPSLVWDIADYNPSMAYTTLDVSLGAKLKNYHKDLSAFTYGFSDLDIASLTNAYNAAHGTSYDPMPKSSISMTPFSFAQGSETATTKLVISRNGLTGDHTYLLPIQFAAASASSSFDLDTSIQYLVVSNPKYGWDWADVSDWKIVFCNSDNQRSGVSMGDSGAPGMIDDNKNTFWMFSYNNYWHDDPVFSGADDYDYTFTNYHACMGDRGEGYSGHQIIVIDMKKQLNVLGVGIIQRQNLTWGLRKCTFAVSADDEFKFKPVKSGGNLADYDEVALNNWTTLFTWNNIPSQKAISSKKVDITKYTFGIKGRYLKVMPILGYSPDASDYHGSCISEVKVMEIVTVDGVPINK